MRKNREIKLIFVLLAVFFAGFLAVPMLSVVVKSFTGDGSGISLLIMLKCSLAEDSCARWGTAF